MDGNAESLHRKAAAAAPRPRVKVLFPLPLYLAFDYFAPDGLRLEPGQWVEAPFGPNIVRGVIWPEREAAPDDDFDALKVKTIASVLAAPPLAPAVIDFIGWTASYTMFPLGSVLRLVMRSGDALERPQAQTGYCATGLLPQRMTPARAAVLEAARRAQAPMTARALAEIAGVSDGVVRGLGEAGALAAETIDPDPLFPPPDPTKSPPALTPEQEAAAGAIISAIGAPSPAPILLDGVTGSGKTEVYLEAVAAALTRDASAQVLILLPEIALTIPFLKRVEARFGAEPAAWHSDLTSAARRRVWRRVGEGQARLVVGARSALFLPFKDLRLIVVDEEHESAYKQEDGVIYHARDLAVARGARGKFPVILASATPSLETVVNVDQGRYGIERLAARFGGARLPEIDLVDMRASPPEHGRWLSPPLVEGINAALRDGGQALLFLNRRGYAPLTICRRCGHRMKAPNSDTWLVEHRFENRLVCHHTGFSMPKPEACPACNAVGALSACGPGVERVAEEAAERWPGAKRSVLSSDTVQSPADMRAVLADMAAGAIDILIATQIVAKGHHFPGLTFVGVVDADMGLAGGDLRAAERTYQLLSQVAGRAGRAKKPGRALLQSYDPDAPVLKALAGGARDEFLAAEAEGRRALGFPPYGRLAAVLLRSQNEKTLIQSAHAHRRAAPEGDGVVLWGPAPAPLYRLRGETRIRFLLKTRRDVNIQAYLDAWLSAVKLPGAVRRIVDIDPYTFL